MATTAQGQASEDDIIVRNPFTGQPIASVPRCSAQDVEQAINASNSYSGNLGPEDRAEILERVATHLHRTRDRFAHLITAESGICISETRREVDRARRNLLVAAAEARRIPGETVILGHAESIRLALTLREPIGVIAAITPFNRPLNQVVVKVAPAIAAGAPIIVKPSEKTPLTCLEFCAALRESGAPPELVSVVTGDPGTVGRALVQSDHIGVITFTGSVEVGEWIAAHGGMKKITLELGGNDPLIILDDADLELASDIAVKGAYATAGQSCRGVKRIIVIDSIADEVAARILAKTRRLKVGDPSKAETHVGPLIDEAAAIRAQTRCSEACKDGAVMLEGGGRTGALFSPTVLDHLDPGSKVVSHETFAPIAPIIRVRDIQEAVSVANGTPYGLQAGIVTRDVQSFLQLAKELRVGGVNLMEGPNFDSPHIPFGGVKKSGLGREGIRYSIDEITSPKVITVPWT